VVPAAVVLPAASAAAPVAMTVNEPDERERKRFINARHTDYKKRRDDLEKTVGENETLESSKKFLRAKDMTVQRFSDLADQIIGEDASWKGELTTIIGCHFLDLVTLRHVDADQSAVKAVFERLRKAGMDMVGLFDSWSVGLVPFYVKDLAKLRKVVQGKV
jgi:hypothetical protein